MVALESALNRGALPIQALAEIEGIAPVWAARPIELATPLSDSGLETIARLLFHRVRVRIRTQVRIGGVRHVDMLVGDRLVIELDGRGFHSGDDFDRDRRQDLELSRRGYLVVRLSYRMVVEEWDETHRRVLELVGRGLHRWGRAARELP
jgi:very-short-patch-repair endonuclease